MIFWIPIIKAQLEVFSYYWKIKDSLNLFKITNKVCQQLTKKKSYLRILYKYLKNIMNQNKTNPRPKKKELKKEFKDTNYSF